MTLFDEANKGTLEKIAINGYHALTGQKPDEAVQERLKAGVDALVNLYKIDRPAASAVTAIIISQVGSTFANSGLAQPYLNNLLGYIATLAEETPYETRQTQ